MEKRIKKKNAALYSVLLLFATYLTVAAMAVLTIIGHNYNLKAGMTAPETIYAPYTITDNMATNSLRDAARERVGAVYRIDAARVSELTSQAKAFFTSIGSLRSYAVNEETLSLSAAEWEAALDEAQKTTYRNMTTPALTQKQLFAVLAAKDSDMKLLENIVLPKLTTALNAGLAQDSLTQIREACIAEIKANTALNDTLKSVGASILEACMQTTYVEDVDATEIARGEAANAVENIKVKKGEPVVLEGDTITPAQIAILEDLALVRPEDASLSPVFGAVLGLLLTFVAFLVFIVERMPELPYETKKMLLVCVLLLLVLGIYLLSEKLNVYISFAMFAVLLCSTLISERMGLLISGMLGACFAFITGETGSYMQFESLSVMVSVFLAGCVSVFAQVNTENRAAYISAGTIGGAAGALALLAMSMMREVAWSSVFANMGYFVGSCLISSLLVVGSLTIWEKLFDAATPARLHELLNTNNPLLKQMMTEAPGTYQHSANVAALCEAAAQRIGANALLARVGAYYHDVGKLRRPLYFAENQQNGVNIHDTLPPQESAGFIISHQKDGVTLLHKYRFPSEVIRLAAEHHGNSLVSYFYYKALKDDPDAQKKDYRYPGNKPSTAESAILMLADSCEAGVRSLGECTREARNDMIRKIIKGKINDNENNLLDDSPLTMKQLSDIEKSFIRTFNGIMHDRIEYPEDLEATKG